MMMIDANDIFPNYDALFLFSSASCSEDNTPKPCDQGPITAGILVYGLQPPKCLHRIHRLQISSSMLDLSRASPCPYCNKFQQIEPIRLRLLEVDSLEDL